MSAKIEAFRKTYRMGDDEAINHDSERWMVLSLGWVAAMKQPPLADWTFKRVADDVVTAVHTISADETSTGIIEAGRESITAEFMFRLAAALADREKNGGIA